jgi:hypothetical protein
MLGKGSYGVSASTTRHARIGRRPDRVSRISSPVQKAFIELDRGGADAAAARLKNGIC